MSSTINTAVDFRFPLPWKDALEQILPAQGSWTDEQYLLLTDHTRLPVEFTDGIVELLPMPTDEHQSILKRLLMAFDAFISPRGGEVLFAPLRVRIRAGKYREPDLLLLLSAADPRREDRCWLGADLVVEIISPDDKKRDLVDKPKDYAEAQIPEYWIVDPESETIVVLGLKGDGYTEAGRFTRGEVATSALLAGFSIHTSSVFGSR
jgi:Uma2 family endonuclease